MAIDRKYPSISVSCHTRADFFTAHKHPDPFDTIVIQIKSSLMYPCMDIFLEDLAALRDVVFRLTCEADRIAHDMVLASLNKAVPVEELDQDATRDWLDEEDLA